jgi:hypothetical protein
VPILAEGLDRRCLSANFHLTSMSPPARRQGRYDPCNPFHPNQDIAPG